MENNKSETANIEGMRTTGFLLGLIMVLALLFVAFEYTTRDQSAADNAEMLDDLASDLEMVPAMDQRDMVSAEPAPASKAVTEKIKAVDQPLQAEEKVAPSTSPLLIGDGEGEAKEANVTEALPQIPVDGKAPLNFRVVDKLPEFPGGMVEFMKWLQRNLRYPYLAQQQKIQGKVVVSFIINTDGTIANAKIEKSIDPLLDREALRVVRMMPKWKPGIENDKPCRTLFAIPIVFKL
ncbi:MAG: TonB family protein [Prevotella sp.]|nr:TonB family protein [Prevotella sp.]